MFKLSKDQKKALDNLMQWHKEGKDQFITLGGYAGTGKTTLISELRNKLHKRNKKLNTAFISYTGRASRILKNKLLERDSIQEKDFVGTIHSLIYSPIENKKGEIIGWRKKTDADIEHDLLIIDEASMVSKSIWEDLLSYNIPIIAVGDHGQLPPVKGNFNLMENPILTLENIHRQAKDNPIIKLSTLARNYGFLPYKNYGENVVKISKKSRETKEYIDNLTTKDFKEGTMILCGYNNTRVKLNKYIRNNLGYTSPLPEKGDKVICLRNNHKKEVFNGMLGTIKSLENSNKDWVKAEIDMEDSEIKYKGSIYTKQFNNLSPINFTKNRKHTLRGDLFDFGYAITVHKAQGSEANKVILFEERFSKMNDEDWSRWLYTAVTRAREELIIIGS